MSLHDTLYRDRPNSLLALPIALAVTFAWWEELWSLGVWVILVFLWTLAALSLWTDWNTPS